MADLGPLSGKTSSCVVGEPIAHTKYGTQLVAASLACKKVEGKMWKRWRKESVDTPTVLYILYEQNREKKLVKKDVRKRDMFDLLSKL